MISAMIQRPTECARVDPVPPPSLELNRLVKHIGVRGSIVHNTLTERRIVMTTSRSPRKPLTITISEAAADHVRKFAEQSGKPSTDLRVAVKGGGCAGLTYVLDLTGPGEDDKTIEQSGIRLHVPKRSYVFLAGTVLEYSGGLNGKGFVFNNPNAKTTCGCGTSFSV